MFVSGAKIKCQASKQSCGVAVDPVTGWGSRCPPTRKWGRVVVCICCQHKIASLWIDMLYTAPSRHSFVIRPIKTSQLYTQHKKKWNQGQIKNSMAIKAKTVLEQNQTEKHQMFSDVFCKHCMQKQIMTKQNVKQHVYDLSPKQTDTKTFL